MKIRPPQSVILGFRIIPILGGLLLTVCGGVVGRASSEEATDQAVAQLGAGFISATIRESGFMLRSSHYVADEQPTLVQEFIEKYAAR